MAGAFRVLVVVSLIFLSACSTASGSRRLEDGAIGGGLGGIAGAATGAAIGGALTNGDVAASALLGTAIGVPAGILLGVYYAGAMEDYELSRNERAIQENDEYLNDSLLEIHNLRQDLKDHSLSADPNPARKEYQFNGYTLGNPYR